MAYTITSSAPGDSLSDATLAAAGIADAQISYANQAQDTLRLIQSPSSWTGAALITQGATVTLKSGSTVVFVGVCLSDPRDAVAQNHQIAYEIAGPWYWLDEIEYRQTHKRWTGAALESVEMSTVILNQAADGARSTSGEQITAALQYAIDEGAPIAIGTITPAVEIPWEQASEIKCSEVIRRMLKWSPNCVAYWDYTTTDGETPPASLPTLHCIPSSAMSAVSVDLAAYTTTRATVRPRYDLQRPGVALQYDRTVTSGGATYYQVETDTAGDHTDIRALTATIPLSGSIGGSAQYQEILTSDFPVSGDPAVHDFLSKAWWKSRVPALAAIADADLVLHDSVVAIEEDDEGDPLYVIADLPRVLEQGQITPWMEAGGFKSAGVTITVQADMIERDAGGAVVNEIKNKLLTLTVTGTDAISKTYSRIELGSYIEDVPAGVAAALYASISILHYDGSLTIVGADPSFIYRPGQKFNIANGLAAWASMNAIIQTAQIDLATGSATIAFGPPKHLSPDDMVALLKRIRTRTLATQQVSRHTGLAGDDAALGGGRGPRNEAAAEGGEPVRSVYTSEGTDTRKIDIDPSAVTDAVGDLVLKPRECLIVESDGSTGFQLKTRSVMASTSYGDATALGPAIPVPSGSDPGTLCYHPGVGLVWVYASTLYQLLQRTSGNVLAFDWTRAR